MGSPPFIQKILSIWFDPLKKKNTHNVLLGGTLATWAKGLRAHYRFRRLNCVFRVRNELHNAPLYTVIFRLSERQKMC